MKWEMDLIREIMLQFEKHSPTISTIYKQEEIKKHVGLLKDFGLIHIPALGANNHSLEMSINILPKGNKFIKMVKDVNIWLKAKDLVSEIDNYTFDDLWQILINLMEEQPNQST